jgi:hypothetical protein
VGESRTQARAAGAEWGGTVMCENVLVPMGHLGRFPAELVLGVLDFCHPGADY